MKTRRISNRAGLVSSTLAALLALAIGAGCDSNGVPTASGANNSNASAANEAPASANSETTGVPRPPSSLADAPTQLSGHVDVPEGTMRPEDRAAALAEQARTQDAPPAPDMVPAPIRFEPAQLDFGLMKPGDERAGTIEIRNLSDKPLRIIGSRASCKCTSVDLANEIIEPGGTIPFNVSMKPDPSPGPKKAQVRIGFEGYGQIAEVEILAEVSLPVNCSPAYISVGDVGLQGDVVVRSIDDQPFTLITADNKAPNFVDFDPVHDSPRSQYTIRYDLTVYDPNNCEEWPGWYMIETDRADCPVVDMRIRAECTIPPRPGNRRWLPTTQREIVGLLKPGDSREFVIPMMWVRGAQRADLINAVVTKSDQFTVDLVATNYSLEEPEITVRVTPKPTHRGLLYGVIELHSVYGNSAPYVVMGRVAE